MRKKSHIFFIAVLLILTGCKAVVNLIIEGGDYEIPYTGIDIMEGGKITLIFEKKVELEPFKDIDINFLKLYYTAHSDLKTFGEVKVSKEGTADTVKMFLEADVPFYFQWVIDQFASLLGYNTNIPPYIRNAPVVYSDTVYGDKNVNGVECLYTSYNEITDCVNQGYMYIIAKVETDVSELAKITNGEIHNIQIEELKIEIEAEKGFEEFGSFIEIGF